MVWQQRCQSGNKLCSVVTVLESKDRPCGKESPKGNPNRVESITYRQVKYPARPSKLANKNQNQELRSVHAAIVDDVHLSTHVVKSPNHRLTFPSFAVHFDNGCTDFGRYTPIALMFFVVEVMMLRGGEVNDIIELKRQGLSAIQISAMSGYDRKTIRQ